MLSTSTPMNTVTIAANITRRRQTRRQRRPVGSKKIGDPVLLIWPSTNSCLRHFSKGFGSGPCEPPKSSGEVTLARETDAQRNLCDREIRLCQQFLRAIDAMFDHVDIRADSDRLFECAREMKVAHVHFFRDRSQRDGVLLV